MKNKKKVTPGIVTIITFLGLSILTSNMHAQNNYLATPLNNQQIPVRYLCEVNSGLSMGQTEHPIILNLPKYVHQGLIKYPVLGKEFSLNAYPVFKPKFSQIQSTLSLNNFIDVKTHILSQINH